MISFLPTSPNADRCQFKYILANFLSYIPTAITAEVTATELLIVDE